MKSYLILIAVSLLILSACTSQYHARNYDDVYYSSNTKTEDNHSFIVKPNKVESEKSPVLVQPVAAPTDDQIADQNSGENIETEGDQEVSGDYFMDDYYDYSYASRMRRFHSNFYLGSYYSDYYCNPYWYDYNPWGWGLSFNSGYPYYSSWHSPWNRWGYGYYDWWYNPYPYYGYWDYSYYHGYWNGFYDGYWYGSAGSYWTDNGNSRHSRYYGHRDGVGGSGGLASNTRSERSGDAPHNSIVSQRGYTERNQETGTLANSSERNGTGNSGIDNTPRRSSLESGNDDSQKPTRYVYQRGQNVQGNQQNQNSRRQGVQPYNSPTYNKPRSGNEYTAPKYRNSGTITESQNNPSRSSTGNTVKPGVRNETGSNPTPSPNIRKNQTSTPQRTYENRTSPSRNTYSNPGKTKEYSTPQRSSTPSSPGKSYQSSPSPSNNSYSAPSRSSGGGSNSSRSSGSSSGSGSGHRK